MNGALTAIFSTLLDPLAVLDPALVLSLVALATALLMLLVFRLTSNQEGIRRAKARVIGQLLAIRLFPDDPWVTLRSLGGALRDNLVYLRHSLVPFLVLLAPLVLLLVQLDLRFSRLPLRPGESTTVGVVLAEPASAAPPDLRLEAPAGLAVETPALWIPSLREVNWRVRAEKPGAYELRFANGARSFSKDLVVAAEGSTHCRAPLVKLSTERTGGGFLAEVFHPAEPRLAADLEVASAYVDYPPREFKLLGFRMHWLVAYFVLSLAIAFLLKRPLGVEV